MEYENQTEYEQTLERGRRYLLGRAGLSPRQLKYDKDYVEEIILPEQEAAYYACKSFVKEYIRSNNPNGLILIGAVGCGKTMLASFIIHYKDYIEDIVVSECRRLLSMENIRRIAKEIVAICEEEKDKSNLKRLKKLLAENERKQENTLNAIMESEIESVRKALGDKIPQLEKEHIELERLIAIEEAPYPNMSEETVILFLTALKKGRVNDTKYRKTLIDIFVNKIYLYDDKVTITYNSGDEPVTITDKLLSDLEKAAEDERVLFMNGSGPPARDGLQRALKERERVFYVLLKIIFCSG